ncbi:MAG: glycosyltransferase family 2 protein [Flavipsychrobacter sp.]
MDRISIIIPYFKAKKYFQDCLESILYQTYQGFEIIIVIDGPHETSQLPYDYLATIKDERISVVEHDKNRGLSASRNTGVHHAKFNWIICIDADDLLPINILEFYAKIISANKLYDFFYGNVQTFGATNHIMSFLPYDKYEFVTNKRPAGAGVLINKKVFAKVNYDENEILRQGNEDYEFWIHVVKRNFFGCYIPTITYMYRKYHSPMSMVGKLMPNIYLTTNYIAEKHRLFLEELGLYKFVIIKGYTTTAYYYYNKNNLKLAKKYCRTGILNDPDSDVALTLMKKIRTKKAKNIIKFFIPIRMFS